MDGPDALPAEVAQEGDSHAAVQAATQALAGDPATLDAAVAQSHATANPAGEVDLFMQRLESRMAKVETALGMTAPVVEQAINDLAPIAAEFVPAVAPIAARLPLIETTLNAILAAFGLHFGGKIALPSPLPTVE